MFMMGTERDQRRFGKSPTAKALLNPAPTVRLDPASQQNARHRFSWKVGKVDIALTPDDR